MKTRAKKTSQRVGRVVPNAPLRLDTHIGVKPRTTLIRRVRDNAPYLSKAAFTLIEMIGVMAIMAILAATLVPVSLRTIEGAAVKAEAASLKELAQQIKFYARDIGALPGAGTWTADLTGPTRYTSLNATEVQTNIRKTQRLYVPDVANQRALIISGMRSGVALPTSGQVLASFQAVWDTPPGSVPASAGWAAWNGSNAEFLLIERVNCRSELQTFPIGLKNASGTASASYLVASSGSNPTLLPGENSTEQLRSGDRIRLFRQGAVLDYTYIVGTRGASLEFNGTTWFSSPSP
jgi:prepilin-type N-terminal cleavage/methylation domain-containing protein